MESRLLDDAGDVQRVYDANQDDHAKPDLTAKFDDSPQILKSLAPLRTISILNSHPYYYGAHGDHEKSASHVLGYCERTRKNVRLILLSFLCAVAGAAYMICFDYANMQYLPYCDGCPAKRFRGPFWQMLCIAVGELSCLGVYVGILFMEFVNRQTRKGLKQHHNPVRTPSASVEEVDDEEDFLFNLYAGKQREKIKWYAWIFPGILDAGSHLCVVMALTYTSSSVVNIIRYFNLLVTAILTVLFLKRDLPLFVWTGIVLLIGGVISSAVLETTRRRENRFAGVLWALGTATLTSFQLVFEEHLFRHRRASPFLAVGIMGVLTSIATALATWLSANAWEAADGSGKLYDPVAAAYQIRHSPVLLWTLIGASLCAGIYTVSAVLLISYAGGLSTAVVFAGRQMLTFIFTCSIGWSHWSVHDVIGVFLCILGFSLFNDFIPYGPFHRVRKFMRITWSWGCTCGCLPPDEEEDLTTQEELQDIDLEQPTVQETLPEPMQGSDGSNSLSSPSLRKKISPAESPGLHKRGLNSRVGSLSEEARLAARRNEDVGRGLVGGLLDESALNTSQGNPRREKWILVEREIIFIDDGQAWPSLGQAVPERSL